MMKKLKGTRPILVEWVDSLRDDNGWVWAKDQKYEDMSDKLNHESVGWVIKETKDFVCLAHSREVFVYEDGDSSVIRSVTIPRRVIKKITKL